MFKFIFFVLVISVFAIYFSDVILDSTTILTVATSSMVGALHLIFQVLAVSFTSMLSFYYLKLALYIGVLFFIVSYILKWLTGHHLMTEEDIDEEEKNTIYDKLKEKDWKDLEDETWKIKNKDMIKLANDDSWYYEELEEEDIETANARWNREYERRKNQW